MTTQKVPTMGHNLEALIPTYEPIIYYQLYRLHLYSRFRSYKDDFLQEGRMAIWAALNSFDESKGTKLTTYINVVVRNALLNYVRSMKLYQNERNITFDEQYYSVDFEEPTESMEELIDTYAPVNHKSILYNYFVEGLTQQDVADKAEVSQQWVSTIIKKFREKLQAEWL